MIDLTHHPLPLAVRGWPREDQEKFIEMSGKQLSDGAPLSLADQRALMEMARIRKQRGVARRNG